MQREVFHFKEVKYLIFTVYIEVEANLAELDTVYTEKEGGK